MELPSSTSSQKMIKASFYQPKKDDLLNFRS
jgi:hypothetical protein